MTRYWTNGSLTVLRTTAIAKNKEDMVAALPVPADSPVGEPAAAEAKPATSWFSWKRKPADETPESPSAAPAPETSNHLAGLM